MNMVYMYTHGHLLGRTNIKVWLIWDVRTYLQKDVKKDLFRRPAV